MKGGERPPFAGDELAHSAGSVVCCVENSLEMSTITPSPFLYEALCSAIARGHYAPSSCYFPRWRMADRLAGVIAVVLAGAI
jgi:hypothetical protein